MTPTTLEELAAALRRIEARLAEPAQPMCFSIKDAAERLGVGLTVMKEMVARREVRTSTVGKRAMISLSELERIAAPDEERPKVVRQQQVKAWKPVVRPPPPPPKR